jgi:membrane fusion protein (multidrug efflux system)
MQTGLFQDAILIPQQAVIALQNMYQVLLLTDSSTVAPTLIKPGMRVGANWIILEGLRAGNKVAIVGNASVKPNSKVKLVDFPWNYTSTLPR